MSIDFERLDAAITYAVEHPDEFDMGAWFERNECGTTACLAGTVALQAGWAPEFDPSAYDVDETCEVIKGGELRSVAAVARELLGLDRPTASLLFYARNLERVIAIRNSLAVEAGVPARVWGAR